MKAPRLATLLVVCALAFLALLAGLLWWQWIPGADTTINAFFGPYRTPAPLTVFLWLTALGANPAIVAVCVTATGLLWVARLPGLILPLWTAFLGGEATSWSLKFLVARARPDFPQPALCQRRARRFPGRRFLAAGGDRPVDAQTSASSTSPGTHPLATDQKQGYSGVHRGKLYR
jgi:hypothetical protein